MTGGEWSQLINKHGCHHQTLSGQCKFTATPCAHWHARENCDDYVPQNGAVRMSNIYPPLRSLIQETGDEMLFIENDDTRFSKQEFQGILDYVAASPVLSRYIEVDLSGKGDYKIAIYPGISRVVFSQPYINIKD